jgi:hypothetical protein
MVPHNNDLIKFQSDEEYEKVAAKSNNQLVAMGFDIKDIIGHEEQIDSTQFGD